MSEFPLGGRKIEREAELASVFNAAVPEITKLFRFQLGDPRTVRIWF